MKISAQLHDAETRMHKAFKTATEKVQALNSAQKKITAVFSHEKDAYGSSVRAKAVEQVLDTEAPSDYTVLDSDESGNGDTGLETKRLLRHKLA